MDDSMDDGERVEPQSKRAQETAVDIFQDDDVDRPPIVAEPSASSSTAAPSKQPLGG